MAPDGTCWLDPEFTLTHGPAETVESRPQNEAVAASLWYCGNVVLFIKLCYLYWNYETMHTYSFDLKK